MFKFGFGICLLLLVNLAVAAPWGSAKDVEKQYKPTKVVYDLSSAKAKHLGEILDRVGYLFKQYSSDELDSAIVIVIHGDAIPLFAIKHTKKYETLMRRAQSLTVGNPIEFRMCRAAAKLLKFSAKHIHGFVSMVPMADAEIIELQHKGYAYMQ